MLSAGLRDIGWELPNGKRHHVCLGEDPGWPHRQHGILYGTDGKGRRHRDSGSKLWSPRRGYVRFALVLPPEKIREAVEAIRKSGLN